MSQKPVLMVQGCHKALQEAGQSSPGAFLTAYPLCTDVLGRDQLTYHCDLMEVRVTGRVRFDQEAVLVQERNLELFSGPTTYRVVSQTSSLFVTTSQNEHRYSLLMTGKQRVSKEEGQVTGI